MREIKFRAYIKDKNIRTPSETNKMVEVKSLHLGSKKAIIGYSKSKTSYGNYSISLGDIELMQFTGLKDKNGKEIYEGDILNIDKEDYKYVVKYYDGCFVGVNKFDEHFEQAKIIGNLFTLEIEVIGNIYENPELIN